MLEQFKTLSDISEEIKNLEGMLLRPTKRLSHPTLYRKRDVKDGVKLIKGVQVGEWYMTSDHKWVLPHDQMGLSFSAKFQHLKGVYKMKQKKNPGSSIDVYWILENPESPTMKLPSNLKFVKDMTSNKGHYFLTVTEPMLLESLVKILKIVAYRMSIIKNAEKAL